MFLLYLYDSDKQSNTRKCPIPQCEPTQRACYKIQTSRRRDPQENSTAKPPLMTDKRWSSLISYLAGHFGSMSPPSFDCSMNAMAPSTIVRQKSSNPSWCKQPNVSLIKSLQAPLTIGARCVSGWAVGSR